MSDLDRMSAEWLDLTDQERRDLVSQIEQGDKQPDPTEPTKRKGTQAELDTLEAEFMELIKSPNAPGSAKRRLEIEREMVGLSE